MTSEGFHKLCFDCELIGTEKDKKTLKEREILTSFFLSLTTHIDEIHSHIHMKMNFYEFLEAYARLADILSFKPTTKVFFLSKSLIFKETWFPERCQGQSLVAKMSNLLPVLIKLAEKKWILKYYLPQENQIDHQNTRTILPQ